MQNKVTIVIVVGTFLMGMPHTFCACGCADVAQSVADGRDAEPKCPHCSPAKSKLVSDPSRPCKCQTCEVIKAVPPGSPVAVAAPDNAWRFHPTPVGASVQRVTASLLERMSHAEPPASLGGVRCALPIFLGHLLF